MEVDKQIKETDEIKDAYMLHIIFGTKNLEVYNDEYSGLYTFKEVLGFAKNNGYKMGVIVLIAESPLHGTVYKYGNHGRVWEKVGATIGYA